MTDTAPAPRSVVIEREFGFPPEKLWRALTVPHLIGEWLMQSDFEPVRGHRFNFSAEWGRLDCEVLELEAHRTLRYSWKGVGLDSIVTWTLTPTDSGTLLRMEQTGFLPEHRKALIGATAGWPRFLARLEQLLPGFD